MRSCDLTTLYIDGVAGGVNTYLLEKARSLADYNGVTNHTIIVPGARHAKQSSLARRCIPSKAPDSFTTHTIAFSPISAGQQLLRSVHPDLIEVDCSYLLGRWAQAATGKGRVPLVGFYHTHLPSFYARPLTQRFGNAMAQMAESCAWRI